MRLQPGRRGMAHVSSQAAHPCLPHCLRHPAPFTLSALQLHVAFSRERTEKEYVQHHMEAHAQEVWSILCNSGGWARGRVGNQACACAGAGVRAPVGLRLGSVWN